MKIICLMPTYGRPPWMLRSSVAQFLRQDHDDKHLLIFDDLGNVGPAVSDQVIVLSTTDRAPHMAAKYLAMDEFARRDLRPDAYAIWDDDDIYTRRHLEVAAQHLRESMVVHPQNIATMHSPPAEGPTPGIRPTGNRYWAAATVDASYLQFVGGFIQTASSNHDQQNLRSWKSVPCGRPSDVTYCYGWGRSRHVSFVCGGPDWYQRHKPVHTDVIDQLDPELDPQARSILEIMEDRQALDRLPRLAEVSPPRGTSAPSGST